MRQSGTLTNRGGSPSRSRSDVMDDFMCSPCASFDTPHVLRQVARTTRASAAMTLARVAVSTAMRAQVSTGANSDPKTLLRLWRGQRGVRTMRDGARTVRSACRS